MDHEEKTALVTGASTGLGFEAAAQLAEEGFGRVIVTARTPAKGGATVERLVARTGMDVFEAITLDNDVLSTVDTAADELAPMGGIDLLILNAGIAPPAKLRRTVDDLDAVVSSSLVGHHRLTVRLLERGQVNENARIVIAGSEAARGDVPMMHPADINDFAAEHFDGDLEAAIETQMRMTSPARYKGNDVYATTKLFAAWWAAELATRLPKGATVNAVSPGATPDTDADRNGTWFLRRVMMPMFKFMPGMSHTIADGAGRYLEAAGYSDDVTGKFFASPPKKMIGPLTEMNQPHLDNPAAQVALWNVTNAVAGVAAPAAT